MNNFENIVAGVAINIWPNDHFQYPFMMFTYEPLDVPVLCIDNGVGHGRYDDDDDVQVAAPLRLVRLNKPKQGSQDSRCSPV